MFFLEKTGLLTALVFVSMMGLSGNVSASETLPANPEPDALYVSEGNIFEYGLKSKMIEDSDWLDMKTTAEPTEDAKRRFVNAYMEKHPEMMRDEVMVVVYEAKKKKGKWYLRIAGFDKKLEEEDKPQVFEL